MIWIRLIIVTNYTLTQHYMRFLDYLKTIKIRDKKNKYWSKILDLKSPIAFVLFCWVISPCKAMHRYPLWFNQFSRFATSFLYNPKTRIFFSEFLFKYPQSKSHFPRWFWRTKISCLIASFKASLSASISPSTCFPSWPEVSPWRLTVTLAMWASYLPKWFLG